MTSLNADLRAQLFRTRRYKHLRHQRRAFIARLNRTIARNLAADAATAVQKEVLSAVAVYVKGSACLPAAVLPVARLIAAGEGGALTTGLSDLSLPLMKSLHVSVGLTRSVVSTALVRHVFAVAPRSTRRR